MMNSWGSRIRSHLDLKLAGVGLYAVGGSGYFVTKALASEQVFTMPWSPIDLLIPEIPLLIIVYLAQLVVLGIPTWLMIDRALLRAHLLGYVAINTISFACFVFVPTQVVHSLGNDGMLGWLRAVDGTMNACPSLHASCVVYATLALPRAIPVSTRVRWIAWIWVALVLLSCVSLRQHSSYDLIAGALLGWLADCGSRWWQHREQRSLA
jgi:membrane-associated phospholipid phosphatase